MMIYNLGFRIGNQDGLGFRIYKLDDGLDGLEFRLGSQDGLEFRIYKLEDGLDDLEFRIGIQNLEMDQVVQNQGQADGFNRIKRNGQTHGAYCICHDSPCVFIASPYWLAFY